MARLCISDGKEEEVMQFGGLSGGTNRLYDCCLVGTFLTASVVQFQAMRNMLANLWHPIAGIEISNLGAKRFLFRFFHRLILKE